MINAVEVGQRFCYVRHRTKLSHNRPKVKLRLTELRLLLSARKVLVCFLERHTVGYLVVKPQDGGDRLGVADGSA